MALYTLIKAVILLVNAVAIINERFLLYFGKVPQHPQGVEMSAKARILSLVGDRNVKVILQVPLIFVNLLLIVMELLLG